MAVLALGLPSCGGSQAPGKTETASAQREATCQALTADFVSSLDRLRRRLVRKIRYPRYIQALATVRAAYDRLPVQQLAGRCLKGAGGLAEDTFNAYIKAANRWAKCLGDSGCDPVAYMPVVERMWWTAGLTLSKVHAALSAESA